MLLEPYGAAAGYDDPLGLIGACHRRIEAKCELLQKLAVHLTRHGCDDDAVLAAAQVRKYFNSAARHHHDDEETDLFPLLAELDGGSGALIERLRSEHRRMEDAWRRLDLVLETVERQAATQLPAVLIEEFVELYIRHIAVEDLELLPKARSVFGGPQLAALADGMARRRGVVLRPAGVGTKG